MYKLNCIVYESFVLHFTIKKVIWVIQKYFYIIIFFSNTNTLILFSQKKSQKNWLLSPGGFNHAGVVIKSLKIAKHWNAKNWRQSDVNAVSQQMNYSEERWQGSCRCLLVIGLYVSVCVHARCKDALLHFPFSYFTF